MRSWRFDKFWTSQIHQSAASWVVVGFSEADWVTVQLDGRIEKIDSLDEVEMAKNLILAKYPESSKYMDASAVFLKFVPTWWRYTDFKTTPPTIIENK